MAGDDEMGPPAWFRKRLAEDKRRYFLAVPSNTTIRDLEELPPEYGGQGRRPKAPFRGVKSCCEALRAGAWRKLTVRDGAKGPLEVEMVARQVESKGDRRVVGEETLVVVRYTEAVCSNTITTSPTPIPVHRCWSSSGWPRRHTGSRRL